METKTFYKRKIRPDNVKGDKTHVITFVDENGNKWGVPEDENNRHYQEYLEWVEAGNTAQEKDELV